MSDIKCDMDCKAFIELLNNAYDVSIDTFINIYYIVVNVDSEFMENKIILFTDLNCKIILCEKYGDIVAKIFI